MGVATLPFDDYGPALAARSLLHFAVTGGLVLLLGWLLELVGPSPAAILLLLGLYTFLYLTVWLVRWLGWRAELDDLRSALDLPAPSPSRLNGRESLPYALLLAGFFLLLRPLAEVLDAPDVPVLRALLLPWLAYPFVALLTGWASGLARGLCPLVPLTAFVSLSLIHICRLSMLRACTARRRPARPGGRCGRRAGCWKPDCRRR